VERVHSRVEEKAGARRLHGRSEEVAEQEEILSLFKI
jgi:hypothetical protein